MWYQLENGTLINLSTIQAVSKDGLHFDVNVGKVMSITKKESQEIMRILAHRVYNEWNLN